MNTGDFEIGKPCPKWNEGEMDIHHIYTGRGEASFLIFPDGTSMLIDAGDNDPATPLPFNFKDMKMCDPLPDSSRRAGEWIARYVKRVNPGAEKVNYLVVSHFHSDHVGDARNKARHTTGRKQDYVLTGIAEAGEYLRFETAVDRNWPDYNYPEPIKPLNGKDSCVINYRAFLEWKIKTEGLVVQAADIGSAEQFVLRKNPAMYQDNFEIRTLGANGKIWKGKNRDTVNYYDLNPGNLATGQNENLKSVIMRVSFGPFRYYTGGDFSEVLLDREGNPVNVEEEAGKICGPCHVCKVNHHSYLGSMTEGFVRNIRAQAYIVPVWDYLHIQQSTMSNMASRELYPGDRTIFTTAFPRVIKEAYAAEPWMASVCPHQGHVVIKVRDGGKRYHIAVLDPRDEQLTVTEVKRFESFDQS